MQKEDIHLNLLALLVFYPCGLDDSLVPVYFRFTLTFRSLFYPLLPLYYFTVGPFCDIYTHLQNP